MLFYFCNQYFKGTWCKDAWDNTMNQYKTCLCEWFKGTGGGSGLITEFESWNAAKFERYGINQDDYDHLDVAGRPPILLKLYAKQKEPYLTIIHIWDKKMITCCLQSLIL